MVAARAELTLVKAARVVEASAFKAKAVVTLAEVAKGAVAVTSSALEARGSTIEETRA